MCEKNLAIDYCGLDKSSQPVMERQTLSPLLHEAGD